MNDIENGIYGAMLTAIHGWTELLRYGSIHFRGQKNEKRQITYAAAILQNKVKHDQEGFFDTKITEKNRVASSERQIFIIVYFVLLDIVSCIINATMECNSHCALSIIDTNQSSTAVTKIDGDRTAALS